MDTMPTKAMAVVIKMLGGGTDNPTRRLNCQVSSFDQCRLCTLTTELQHLKISTLMGNEMFRVYGAEIGDTYSLTVFVHNLNSLRPCAPKSFPTSRWKLRLLSLHNYNFSMYRGNPFLS
jgi:hypothetical protein